MIEYAYVMTGQWINRAPYTTDETLKTRTFTGVYTVERGTVTYRKAYLEIAEGFRARFDLPSIDSFSVVFFSLVLNDRL